MRNKIKWDNNYTSYPFHNKRLRVVNVELKLKMAPQVAVATLTTVLASAQTSCAPRIRSTVGITRCF